jgi:hypothetical protein
MPPRPRSTVEKLALDCLDVGKLSRAGVFQDRWISYAPLLHPRIFRIRIARYAMLVELNDRLIPQQIRVSWTHCHFGGNRPWLHCACGRRVGKLYAAKGGYVCRGCAGNPLYASQTKSAAGRRHYRASKLRLLLNGNASLTSPMPDRPRNMRRKTYARVKAQIEDLENGLSPRQKRKAPDYKNLSRYF